ncbi:PP2C family protein-serine/threonine phosphatase [Streptomyces sp. NBC_00557]|uniref:PP2C family protein-serine/threonine phosphatase n=1 Tax=Streptomyces sp. NBC_00557 TaxID=2975776 RepID=UPI002E80106C|nr:PP2C family protein-serine/threonine phosphatase [Streptomyces sp. NBC_00557]WUC39916.1 serine/threonine-protein phosphatase [Streptomyces sp. NBC_00557]
MEYGRRRQPLHGYGRNVALVSPLLLLGGIVLLDFGTSERFRIVSWIVLVPGTAAAICGVWTTGCYAVLAVVAFIAVDSAWPHQYRAGLADFILVALGGLLAVVASAARMRKERHDLHIQDIAETTRRTVLRPLPTPWAGLEHAGVYLAADVDARVGGDFYDIQPSPHGPRVLVGDVQGKGLGAVETAAALLGTFREAGYHEKELATVAERLETRMLRHRWHVAALGRDDGDRFATAVLIGFPEGGPGNIELVNFGHEAALAVGPRGLRELPSGDGLPIGFGDLGGGLPPVHRVRLADDETLLLVTDGVTEARDRGGAFYPLVKDITAAVTTDPAQTNPRTLVRRVRDGVLHHCRGGLADDTTVFAVRRLRAAGGEEGREGDEGETRSPA